MPSQCREFDARQCVRVVDVHEHPDRRAGARAGRSGRVLHRLALARAAFLDSPRVALAHRRRGRQHETAPIRVDDGFRSRRRIVGTARELHQHRDAMRAGEHGHVAGGASRVRRHGSETAAVELEKPRGRQLVRDDDAALGQRISPGIARERHRDTRAQVAQVGGSIAKIGGGSRLVVRDLPRKVTGPGPVRRETRVDVHPGRTEKLLVLEEAHLEPDDVPGEPPRRVGERAQSLERSSDRFIEGGTFVVRVAGPPARAIE